MRDRGQLAKRRQDLCLIGEQLLQDVVHGPVEVSHPTPAGRQRADGVVESVVFLGQGRRAVAFEQPIGRRAVERYGAALLLDRQELRTDNWNDTPFFDEGEQVIPEFLDIEWH